MSGRPQHIWGEVNGWTGFAEDGCITVTVWIADDGSETVEQAIERACAVEGIIEISDVWPERTA